MNVFGTTGNDTLSGSASADQVFGNTGDDDIFGGAGNDTLFGGQGNDEIGGGAGNDLVYAGAGDDTAFGGLGNDMLYGGAGNDALYGGAGNDSLFGGAGDDSLFGGEGGDVIILQGDRSDWTISRLDSDHFQAYNAELDQTKDIFDVGTTQVRFVGAGADTTLQPAGGGGSTPTVLTYYTGETPDSVQKPNGDFLPGSGIDANGFYSVHAERGEVDVTVGVDPSFRGGAGITASVNDGSGDYEFNVPDGPDPNRPAGDRPEFVWHWFITAGDDGDGPRLGADRGDIGVDVDLTIKDAAGNVVGELDLDLFENPDGSLYLGVEGTGAPLLGNSGGVNFADTGAIFPSVNALLGGHGWDAGYTIEMDISTYIDSGEAGGDISLTDQNFVFNIVDDEAI